MKPSLFDENEDLGEDEDLLALDQEGGVELLSPEEAISYIQHADSSPLYEHYRVVADKGQALLRVDKFLASRMMGSSRSRIQQALRSRPTTALSHLMSLLSSFAARSIPSRSYLRISRWI